MADLTTKEKVRTQLGMDESATDADPILSQLITSSSAWVERRLGQEVLTRTVTETRDGDWTAEIQLQQFPVTAVTSVTVDGEAIPARATVDGEGWVLDGRRICLTGYTFDATYPQNVVIVYTAGYATCPSDLEQAVIEHVALRYRDRRRSGLSAESLSGESATYNDAGSLAYIMGVIDASPLNVWAIA